MPSKRMKAAICQGESAIEVEQVAVPLPGPGYVLLKTHNCGERHLRQ